TDGDDESSRGATIRSPAVRHPHGDGIRIQSLRLRRLPRENASGRIDRGPEWHWRNETESQLLGRPVGVGRCNAEGQESPGRNGLAWNLTQDRWCVRRQGQRIGGVG